MRWERKRGREKGEREKGKGERESHLDMSSSADYLVWVGTFGKDAQTGCDGWMTILLREAHLLVYEYSANTNCWEEKWHNNF